MVAIRLDKFGGMIPAVSRRLLPDNMAELAINSDMSSGELQPFPAAVQEVTLDSANYKKAVKVYDPDNPEDYVWVPLRSRNGAVYRSPLTNDLFDRYIKLDDNGLGQPARLLQNSYSRIVAGQPWLYLGVPPPSTAPNVSVTGGSPPSETRSYVFTYVNIFGEEGAPSPPSALVTGNIGATWTVSGFAVHPDADNYGLASIRIYRTITGSTGTFYYRVAEVPLTTTTYSDTIPNTTVINQAIELPSQTWREPELVEGIVPMPNGFFAAWRGRDVMFSEPYRPWAWPANYITSINHNIIGAAVFGSTLVAVTESSPALLTGITPAQIAIERADFFEPGVSPTAVVSSMEGVYYAGRSGLVLISPGNAGVVTRNIISPLQWQRQYAYNVISMAATDKHIMWLTDVGYAYVIDKHDPRLGVVKLRNIPNLTHIWTDNLTKKILGVANNVVNGSVVAPAVVYDVFSSAQSNKFFGWRSKEFVFPAPVNFGAAVLYCDSNKDTGVYLAAYSGVNDTAYVYTSPRRGQLLNTFILGADTLNAPLVDPIIVADTVQIYNTATLNATTLNSTALCRVTSPSSVTSQLTLPTSIPPTAVTQLDLSGEGLPEDIDNCVVIRANGRVVWARPMANGKTYRLPSGFKSTIWQFDIISKVRVYSLQVAEVAKELASV